MTRDELIAELKLKARQLRILRSVNAGCEAMGLECAATLAEQLDPSPTMKWQSEPDCDGWHYVRQSGKRYRACRLQMIPGKGWHCDGAGGLRPLNGRLVCRIPSPPQLPKRGKS